MVGKLLEVTLGRELTTVFGSLTKNPLTRRVEASMTRSMREALLAAFVDVIHDARRDGSMPMRTGAAYRKLLIGGRAFGTTFASLRGHIIGPDYIVAHQRGTLITPNEAPQLAIPMPAALRPDGTPKLPGPRSWRIHGSFVYFSKRTQRGYIARNVQGRLELLYAFVDEAQLKKHKGFIDQPWARQLPKLFNAFGLIFQNTIESIDPDVFVTAGDRGGKRARVKRRGR